jgi:hypothetical protein
MLLLKNRQAVSWALPHCLAVDEWAVADDGKVTLVASGKKPLSTKEAQQISDLAKKDASVVEEKKWATLRAGDSFDKPMIVTNAVFYSRWAVACGCRLLRDSGSGDGEACAAPYR